MCVCVYCQQNLDLASQRMALYLAYDCIRQACTECIFELFPHWRSTGKDLLHARQIESIYNGAFRNSEHDGRHDRDHSDAMPLDDLEEIHDLEPLHDRDGGPGPEGAKEHRIQAEDVDEGKDA